MQSEEKENVKQIKITLHIGKNKLFLFCTRKFQAAFTHIRVA
jgi:hypothetical protein